MIIIHTSWKMTVNHLILRELNGMKDDTDMVDFDQKLPAKRTRSSPLVVNPSNSGVIDRRFAKKYCRNDDLEDEIKKSKRCQFFRVKEKERQKKIIETKVFEEMSMFKAKALKEETVKKSKREI